MLKNHDFSSIFCTNSKYRLQKCFCSPKMPKITNYIKKLFVILFEIMRVEIPADWKINTDTRQKTQVKNTRKKTHKNVHKKRSLAYRVYSLIRPQLNNFSRVFNVFFTCVFNLCFLFVLFNLCFLRVFLSVVFMCFFKLCRCSSSLLGFQCHVLVIFYLILLLRETHPLIESIFEFGIK